MGGGYTAVSTALSAAHRADLRAAATLQEDAVNDGQARPQQGEKAMPPPDGAAAAAGSTSVPEALSGAGAGAGAAGAHGGVPAVLPTAVAANSAAAEAGFVGPAIFGAGATTEASSPGFDVIGVEQEPLWWWPAAAGSA